MLYFLDLHYLLLSHKNISQVYFILYLRQQEVLRIFKAKQFGNPRKELLHILKNYKNFQTFISIIIEVPFLYLLKTSENLSLSDVFRRYGNGILG